jgi:hypothetical protein
MISYADLEFAISRWKARAAGVPQQAAPIPSGAVAVPMPVSTAPDYAGEADGHDGVVPQEESISGTVVMQDESTSGDVVPDGDLFNRSES